MAVPPLSELTVSTVQDTVSDTDHPQLLPHTHTHTAQSSITVHRVQQQAGEKCCTFRNELL